VGPETERHLRADAARNVERIVRAARAAFADDGPDVSLEEIARRAGVGSRTLYRHFPNKGDLVAALVADRFRRLAERAQAALGEEDPWQAFCQLIRDSAKLQMSDRALSEFISSQPELGQQAAVESGLVDTTEQLMVNAQKAGNMREDAVIEDVPTMMCGLCAITAGAAGSMPELNWERYVEIMLDGLRAPGRNALPPPRGSLPR
jgi:AcrR family transcriptional regulator